MCPECIANKRTNKRKRKIEDLKEELKEEIEKNPKLKKLIDLFESI